MSKGIWCWNNRRELEVSMQNKQSTAATLFPVLHPLPPTLWVSICHVISTKVRLLSPTQALHRYQFVSVNDYLLFPLIAILLHLEFKFTSIPSTGLSKLADIQTGPHSWWSFTQGRMIGSYVTLLMTIFEDYGWVMDGWVMSYRIDRELNWIAPLVQLKRQLPDWWSAGTDYLGWKLLSLL